MNSKTVGVVVLLINIDSNNPNFELYEYKLVIRKTSKENENFDVLHFSDRSIEKVTIPSFIKLIQSYTFENCKRIQKVEISSDSQLEIICEFAFFGTLIEKFTITSNLEHISNLCFYKCSNLLTFEFSENSKLQTIGK